MGPNLNIFTIYTSEDTDAMYQVLSHLKSYKEYHKLSIWHEDPIRKGQQWKPQIESHFNEADIFLLFVSSTFMYSEFIQQLEFKMVIDKYKEGKSTVIPIILENCPWDTDFNSDDYNFSFKELQVLPEERRPIKDWGSSEEAYDNVAVSIKSTISALLGNEDQDEVQTEVKEEEEEEVKIAKTEEQIPISFNEEKEEEEEKKHKEEVAAKRIADENRVKEEREASNRAKEEQRLESKRRAEEQKIKKEAEAKKIEEERRLKEVEAKRQAQQKRREEESRKQAVVQPTTEVEETEQAKGSSFKKRLLIGAAVAVLAIIAIWGFNNGSDEKTKSSDKTVEVEDSIPLDKTEIEPIVEEEGLSELLVGDNYNGGMIFAIDAEGRTGKIVHLEDAGPMTWANAINIHEQLGEGWYLPTLDELRLLYKTVGQGAENNAEFSNGMYWSATAYDEYQARLLRFRDSNTSYHYNKLAEHRKYRVRAVRNFSR